MNNINTNRRDTMHCVSTAPTFLAIIFALAFTLSCSSDDGDDNGGATGGGYDTLDSQIYDIGNIPEGCSDGTCLKKWNGNGTITLTFICPNENIHVNGGKITNGKISLDLPDVSEIPEGCFGDMEDAVAIIDESEGMSEEVEQFMRQNISISPPNAKSTYSVVIGVLSDANVCTVQAQNINGKNEGVSAEIGYFLDPVTMTGNLSLDDYNKMTISVNATTGWDMLYTYTKCEENNRGKYCKSTMTNNLKSVNLKPIWTIYCN